MRIDGNVVSPRLLTAYTAPEQKPSASFRDLLAQGLEQVHALQQEADAAILQLALGETDNLHQVMIAVERASLALELTIAIRNRLLDAFQEIMRMQV
ncbi:MAG: flagellar hook-basal body complex protein FliE [Limnochordales bacterium]|nr:flagellar hook-basal body complex protein FliE [Bacillota bacterium]